MGRWAVVLLLLLTGCSAPEEPDAGARWSPPSDPASSATATPSRTAAPSTSSTSATPSPSALPRVRPDDVRLGVAVEAVEHLAGRVGPRPGTSPAYHRAARWATRKLRGFGWAVREQPFPTPGGVSWGVPVAAGRSVNLIATRGRLRVGEPWLLVGAHLDTVPQSPGAEDNASGVGVVLAVAATLEGRRTRLPVVLALFGSEEPRGPSDADHHYGSRAYVAALPPAQRRSLRGMLSLDRVGVGPAVVIGSVSPADPLRAEVVRAARRAGVRFVVEDGQRSSDHWSFVRAGRSGVRLGSTPYTGYHSPGDVPSVVSSEQLERAARTVVAWLR